MLLNRGFTENAVDDVSTKQSHLPQEAGRYSDRFIPHCLQILNNDRNGVVFPERFHRLSAEGS